MAENTWMIYGATGYTGGLLAAEARRRGHRPVLAGRSEQKLARLAADLALEWTAVSLDDAAALTGAVAAVDLVFHAAGPFTHTARPMVEACLAAGVNYLDITGELSVLAETLTYDQAARRRGILLLSGAGFDVIPTDCLARYVADQRPGATRLETAVAAYTRPTAGTTRSMLEMLPQGILARKDGELVAQPWGRGAKSIRFSSGEQPALPVSWGDLVTAYRTTGIPTITTYMAYPAPAISLIRLIGPLGQKLMGVPAVRRLAQGIAGAVASGPDEETRRTARTSLWARAVGPADQAVEAWLETPEPYHFTAAAGVRCVEEILDRRPQGALTPALAFGPDFVLELDGVERFDRLPDRS